MKQLQRRFATIEKSRIFVKIKLKRLVMHYFWDEFGDDSRDDFFSGPKVVLG